MPEISEEEHLKHSVLLHRKTTKKTWPLLRVACERWSQEQYSSSFKALVKYLKQDVDHHKTLRDSARNIHYMLTMVGSSLESAKPSVLVLCNYTDWHSLNSLLKKMPRQEYNCMIPSTWNHAYEFRFRDGGLSKMSKSKPTLWLYLCPTSFETLKRLMKSVVKRLGKKLRKRPGSPPVSPSIIPPTIKIECSSLATMCGALAEFEGRQSTISLTLDVDGEGRLLTVEHIFQDNKSENDEPQVSLDPESLASIESNIEKWDCFNDSEDYIPMDLGTESNHDDTQMDREFPTTCVSYNSSQGSQEPIRARYLHADYRFSRYYYKPGDRVEPPNSLPRRSPDLDWACLRVTNHHMTERQRPNVLLRPGKLPVPLEGIATKPRTHAVPIYMISGIVGVRSGRLIESPSYLGSSKGQDLCETWTIILDQQEGFYPGESGSLVVDQETFKIYGHLVGSDMFGYGHVVPLSRTIEQIKTAFNVDNAGLPARGNHGPLHEGDMGSKEKDDEELVLLLRDGWPDIYKVERLIERGADVNRPDTNGETPLWRAARKGDRLIVEHLLENGADLSMPSIYCETPLWGAVGAGHLDIAKLLLEHGADPSALNEYGETLLWRSASRGHLPTMKFLLENGADLTIPDKYGQTPLWIAAENGFLPVVQLLLSLGSEVDCKDEHSRTPLYTAVKEGHHGIIEALVKAGADINTSDKNGQTPLYLAAAEGHHGIFELLLKAGADINTPDKDGQTPLQKAAARGHYSIVELLREAGAEANTKDDAVRVALLSIAIKEGHSDHLEQLIKAGAEVNYRDKNGCLPLLMAIRYGHPDIIQQLLKAGAELNVRDENGDTPLLTAMRYEQSDVIPLLVEAGIDVNTKDKDGLAPLLSAAQEGCSGICKELIKAGALLDSKDNSGQTALFRAARKGRHRVVQILIEGGAEVNARDKAGRTPLFSAVQGGDFHVLGRLIKAGVLLDSKDIQGRTALFGAVEEGKEYIIEMLIKGGAATEVEDNTGQKLITLAERGGVDLSKYLAKAQGSEDEREDQTSRILRQWRERHGKGN